MAVFFNEIEPIKTYFLPQYRAFELLLGAATALGTRSRRFILLQLDAKKREAIAWLSLALMLLPVIGLNEETVFPGVKTLYPCVGAALYLAFSGHTLVARWLRSSWLVSIGLISYPLYLYHQPVISTLHLFEMANNNILMFVIVLSISLPFSWLTYKYIETPVRKRARVKRQSDKALVSLLSGALIMIALIGLFIAKFDGVGWRFKILNPFAYKVTQQGATTFHSNFRRGMNVSKSAAGEILFVGDSVLQQYVLPIINALGIDSKDVDTVTRGGCVLLKNVEFRDSFSDISCNELRDELFRLDKQYRIVVLSQNWIGYSENILNLDPAHKGLPLLNWKPFINETIAHFTDMADHVVLIGMHPLVAETSHLRPNLFLSEQTYRSMLTRLHVTNLDEMRSTRSFFDQWNSTDRVYVIHPMDIWSRGGAHFNLHDERWAYFSDTQHAGQAATDYIATRLKNLPAMRQLMRP